MRISEGSLLSEYVGRIFVIDSKILGQQDQWLTNEMCRIIDTKQHPVGACFEFEVLDSKIIPAPVMNMVRSGQTLSVDPQSIEVAPFNIKDTVSNGFKTLSLDALSYNHISGFVYDVTDNQGRKGIMSELSLNNDSFKLIKPPNMTIKIEDIEWKVQVEAGNPCSEEPVKELTRAEKQRICNHPFDKRYKNVISANLKFWSCGVCGADLGNINE